MEESRNQRVSRHRHVSLLRPGGDEYTGVFAGHGRFFRPRATAGAALRNGGRSSRRFLVRAAISPARTMGKLVDLVAFPFYFKRGITVSVC